MNDRIRRRLNEDKRCRPYYTPGILISSGTGPTGPTGPAGETSVLSIDTVTTGDPGTDAKASYYVDLTLKKNSNNKRILNNKKTD